MARAHDRPALERAALAVHGEAVDERDAHDPRQQAGVLDGVPTPVAAPAEHDVRPDGAKADAHAQEEPGEQRVALRAHDPFLRRIVHDDSRDGVRERDGETRVAHEQSGRMDGHGPVLQQRVHTQHRSCSRQIARAVEVLGRRSRKRHVAFGEQDHAHERRQHQLRHEQRHRIQLPALPHIANGHHRVEDGDEPTPEQQRAFAACPQTRQLVEPGDVAGRVAAIAQHVLDAGIAGHEAVHQHAAAHGQSRQRHQHGHMPAPRQRLACTARLLAGQQGSRDQAHDGHRYAGECDEHSYQTYSWHVLSFRGGYATALRL